MFHGGGREGGHHGQDKCPGLGGEVSELRFEDLHLMRECIAFARKSSVRVGCLLHNQGQGRGLLRLGIEGTAHLLESELGGLGVDTGLFQGHAVALNRIALPL
jgi:hypothetical protein